MKIGLLLLLACLIYIGIDYGRRVYNDRRLQLTFEPFELTRYIFILGENVGKVQEYVDLRLASLKSKNIKLLATTNLDNSKLYRFENGDEMWVVQYEKGTLPTLTKEEIENYNNKIFFDCNLPRATVAETIIKLGLEDYAITVGICKGDDENAV